MKITGCLMLAVLIASAGCMDGHGLVPGQHQAKNAPAAIAPALPSRPPVTEDQVTEANAAVAVQALTDELNREASAPPPVMSRSDPAHHERP